MAGAQGSKTFGELLLEMLSQGRESQQRLAELEREARFREAIERIAQKGATQRTRAQQRGQSRRTRLQERGKATRQEDKQEHEIEKQKKGKRLDIRKSKATQRAQEKRELTVEEERQKNRLDLEEKRIAGRKDVKRTVPGKAPSAPKSADSGFPSFETFRDDVDDRTKRIERKIENQEVVGGDASRMTEIASDPRREALRQIVRELIGDDLENLSFSSERDLYRQMAEIDAGGGGAKAILTGGAGGELGLDPRVEEAKRRALERLRAGG